MFDFGKSLAVELFWVKSLTKFNEGDDCWNGYGAFDNCYWGILGPSLGRDPDIRLRKPLFFDIVSTYENTSFINLFSYTLEICSIFKGSMETTKLFIAPFSYLLDPNKYLAFF